jgi:leucyl aminopeptidase
MAEQASALGRTAGLRVRVWTDAELRTEGFGGLLAVGGGSATPPRLVQVDYEPRKATRKTPRVVLVGKGITFDTGGLDIKPAEGMLAMKTDMSGSAIVLAVLAACRDLEVPVRVTGLLALAENAVGAASYRPGDVITQYGGRTVEIGNTDAEGRLVLADALAYADRHLDPDILLDIATLTGAARVAFGRSLAPVYATDDALREALVAAGERTGERLWPLPLVADYRALLDSEVADINHIAGPRGGAGSITAALFLREFAGDRRWAHLDIAGTGRSDVDRGLLSKGATGFGARLLLTWLEDMR